MDGQSATGIEVRDFYIDYQRWALANNKEVLSATKIGMVLQRFMRTEYVTLTKDGETKKYYNSLAYRQGGRGHMNIGSLNIPPYMKISTDGEVRLITVDSVFVTDLMEPVRMQIYLDVGTCKYNFYLEGRLLDNNDLGLDGVGFLDQVFIDTIIKIGRNLRLCMGKPGFVNAIEKSDKVVAVEIVKKYFHAGLITHVVFTRIKHKECLGYVNLLGSTKTTTCRPCQHKINSRFLMQKVDSYITSQIIDVKDDDINLLLWKHGQLPMGDNETAHTEEDPSRKQIGGAMRYRSSATTKDDDTADAGEDPILHNTEASVGLTEVSAVVLTEEHVKLIDQVLKNRSFNEMDNGASNVVNITLYSYKIKFAVTRTL